MMQTALKARVGRTLALLFAFSVAIGISKNVSATEDLVGAWGVVTLTDAFQTDAGPSRWRYWIDAQARYFDLGSGASQYLVRPAIGFKPGNNLSVWAGYARFRTRGRSSENVVDENRYWQQVSWTAARWRGGTFSMRARLLQRFVDAGDDMALVLRTLVRYDLPIGDDGRHSFILGLEPFFDLRTTDWGGDAGIFQNRVYVGLGWRVLDKLRIEAGYMNQFFWVDNGEDVSNHLLVVNFRTRF